MKKLISLLLVMCIFCTMFCVFAQAKSLPIAGDVNADGKVTPYDALQVQSYLHGEISLSQSQIDAAIAACPSIDRLSTAHIVAIFFKPLSGNHTQAPEADGLYHIESVADLAKMRAFPYAGFSLDADLDMAGESWSPFIFNGTLLGNGHTISNLTVSAATTNVNAGALFMKLGSANNKTAAVSNLTLENVQLTTTSAHKYAGIVCGSNYGTLSDVSLLNTKIKGAVNTSENAVGAEAGMNYGNVTANVPVELDLAYNANTQYVVGGNAAGASAADNGSIKVTNNGAITFAKENFCDTTVSRQTVYDEMLAMSQIKWKSNTTVTYKDTDYLYTVEAGKVYTGMPYTHQSANLQSLKDNCELVGDTYVSGKPYESYNTTEFAVPTNTTVMGTYFGNDCSSAVYWAWAKVSRSFTGERSRRFIPAPNQLSYGCIKIGNYQFDPVKGYTTSWDSQWSSTNTSPATHDFRSMLSINDGGEHDGEINYENLNALYEAYALCQLGDCVSFVCDGTFSGGNQISAGHSRMVVSVTTVRDGEGRIDPALSKIATIEQGTSMSYSKSTTTWGQKTYTFKELAGIENGNYDTLRFEKGYRVYVPATCNELLTGTRDAAYIELKNSTSPFDGIVSSNYRIVSTEVTIGDDTDKSFTGEYGWNVGVDASSFVPYEGITDSGMTTNKQVKAITATKWEASRIHYISVNLEKHADHFANLPSGTYPYSITVVLSTGEQKTFSGTYTK